MASSKCNVLYLALFFDAIFLFLLSSSYPCEARVVEAKEENRVMVQCKERMIAGKKFWCCCERCHRSLERCKMGCQFFVRHRHSPPPPLSPSPPQRP
ncbi:OLC1v1017108C1 [Oldenlandia corymbosa var. corymbosa]|uniref:OLC1v1017108C1 n=1 Tax=Oldenlandia corymbosa var. corymbosa TaxID=529605 RepID=A0AAV1E8P8_OLDCO|nr:OLC1v1017108C1 [Oldenlandia corymbosa var. corymbosa]